MDIRMYQCKYRLIWICLCKYIDYHGYIYVNIDKYGYICVNVQIDMDLSV